MDDDDDDDDDDVVFKLTLGAALCCSTRLKHARWSSGRYTNALSRERANSNALANPNKRFVMRP